MGVKYIIAGLWGFLESTLFFIVPDVWLTRLALDNLRTALIAACITGVCALIGGIVIYYWALHHYDHVYSIFVQIPAISPKMIATAQQQVDAHGMVAMFIGPMSGTPYKIYCMIAAYKQFSLLLFLILSIPARLIRFIMTIFLAHLVSIRVLKNCTLRQKQFVHLGFWLILYSIWFIAMSQ